MGLFPVDPDNRRPVDYRLRQTLLAETVSLTAAGAMARADEGVPKLWLIARLLARRRSAPELFQSPTYEPIAVAGAPFKGPLDARLTVVEFSDYQ